MSIRTEKVASLIKEEIGTILNNEFSGSQYGFITVTEVKMSPDLKIAKVYVTIFGDEIKEKETFTELKNHKWKVRSSLAAHLKLKYVPEIQFYIDETFKNVNRIESLIRSINKNDA